MNKVEVLLKKLILALNHVGVYWRYGMEDYYKSYLIKKSKII
jgi:hypothetical protein